MSYRLHFRHDRLPDMNTRASRRHAYVQSGIAKRWREIVEGYVLEAGKPDKPLEVARVTLVRHSSVQPDYDNMAASWKSAILDPLVKHGVLANDRPKNFVGGHPDYAWAPAPRGKGYVTVTVEEI